jgi:hypothetical protein
MGSISSRNERYFESPAMPTTRYFAVATWPGGALPKVFPIGFWPWKMLRAKGFVHYHRDRRCAWFGFLLGVENAAGEDRDSERIKIRARNSIDRGVKERLFGDSLAGNRHRRF